MVENLGLIPFNPCHWLHQNVALCSFFEWKTFFQNQKLYKRSRIA